MRRQRLRESERGRLRQQEVAGQIAEKESPMLKKSPRNLHKGAFETLLSTKLYEHSVKFHKAGQEMQCELNNTQSTPKARHVQAPTSPSEKPSLGHLSGHSAEIPKGVSPKEFKHHPQHECYPRSSLRSLEKALSVSQKSNILTKPKRNTL